MSWMALWVIAALAGCGELERDNPRDPHSPQFVDLSQLLIGSWGRNDQEANEVYFFKSDGTVQLLDFSCYQSGPGDPVDRAANSPCHTLFGNYFLDGDELRISFNEVTTLPGQPPVSLPRTDRVAKISIKRNVLTLAEADVTRFYSRM